MPKGRKSKDKVVLQPFTSSKPQVNIFSRLFRDSTQRLNIICITSADIDVKYSVLFQVIVDWVYQQLSLWVKRVQTIEEVEEKWLTFYNNQTSNSIDDAPASGFGTVAKTSVRVLLLSHLLQPPLFLAALSIKFTGRIHFGMFTVKKEDTEAVRKRLHLNERKMPVYLVVSHLSNGLPFCVIKFIS